MNKKLNLATGRLGEEIATRFLEEKGYKILFRNFKTKYSEIDLIAQKRKPLIFVEVKTRKGEAFGSPEEAINRDKKDRLKKAAQAFVAFHQWAGPFQIDVLAIVLGQNNEVLRLTHYENITS